MRLGLGLGVVEVHGLALWSRLLQWGRMGLVWWSRGISLTLLPSCRARALGEPWSHDLGVGTYIRVGSLSHPRPHSSILALISRVLVCPVAPHALLGVLVRVWGLTGGGVGVSGCVAHIGKALSLLLLLRMWMSHLGPSHPNMSQVVRGVLSRGGCHALGGVVLVHTCCVCARRALHPTVVSLRHLVAPHLVGTTL